MLPLSDIAILQLIHCDIKQQPSEGQRTANWTLDISTQINITIYLFNLNIYICMNSNLK